MPVAASVEFPRVRCSILSECVREKKTLRYSKTDPRRDRHGDTNRDRHKQRYRHRQGHKHRPAAVKGT
jgi:hypothetical protein